LDFFFKTMLFKSGLVTQDWCFSLCCGLHWWRGKKSHCWSQPIGGWCGNENKFYVI